MAERILFVDDVPEVLGTFERLLENRYEIVCASGGADALEKFRHRGPFPVVVADYEMPGMKGTELLMRIHEEAPDTIAILMTGVVDVDVAIDAVHIGRIFRFLEKPCPQAHLVSALVDAFEESRRVARERELNSTMRFSRDALAHFNGALNRLLASQGEALSRLNQFVCALNAAESLEIIAELAAHAAHEILDRRGVEVALCTRANGPIECRSQIGSLGERSVRLPATTHEGEVGWIAVEASDREHRQLSSMQSSLLASIASATAAAAANQVRRRERDAAQHATILALAKLAEQRDNETGKHLERVSQYCVLIAEGLRADGWYCDQIDDSFVRDLFRSAPLHDIGKVGIPDAILLKPGKLDEREWEVMKTHTDIGASTLRAVIESNPSESFLRMSLDIAWCHHEWWSGGGYPRGLSGEAIPLAARVLALADVYDALTSVRVYKEAWSHERALDWIREQSGAQFDPRCVESFVRRGAEADRVRRRLADTREEVLAQLRLAHVSEAAT